MRSPLLSRPGPRRTFTGRRGLAWLAVISLVTTLTSVGSTAQAQAIRASFHTQRGFHAKLDALPGLYIATYQTPEGKILAYLPADLHTGESVVGTMRLEPKGKDETARAASLTALAAYHLLWGTQSQAAQETPVTWTLPAGEPTDAGRLTLTDAQAHPLAQTDMPVATPLPSSPADAGGDGNVQTPGSAADGKIDLPRRGVVGRPLVLQAPVGAEALAYQVLVGDKHARLLAASPRSLIVQSPDKVFGKTVLQLRKGDQTLAETAFRSDRVSHSFNPWPYVIGSAVVIGIVGILAVNDLNNGLHHIGDHINFPY